MVGMRILCSVLVCLVLATGMVYGQSACIQDQYGNQYNYTVDNPTGDVYGSVTNVQGCAAVWPLTGSFVKTSSGGRFLELTAANPNGTADACYPTYMVKGAWPNFDWYYAFGPSPTPQPGTWVACGAKGSDTATGKGSVK